LLPKPSILPSKPASMRSFCLTFFAIGEEEEKGRFLVDGDETSRSFIVVVAVVVVIDVGGGALLLREEEGGTVFFQTGVVPVLAPLPLRRKARTTMMKTTVGN